MSAHRQRRRRRRSRSRRSAESCFRSGVVSRQLQSNRGSRLGQLQRRCRLAVSDGLLSSEDSVVGRLAVSDGLLSSEDSVVGRLVGCYRLSKLSIRRGISSARALSSRVRTQSRRDCSSTRLQLALPQHLKGGVRARRGFESHELVWEQPLNWLFLVSKWLAAPLSHFVNVNDEGCRRAIAVGVVRNEMARNATHLDADLLTQLARKRLQRDLPRLELTAREVPQPIRTLRSEDTPVGPTQDPSGNWNAPAVHRLRMQPTRELI